MRVTEAGLAALLIECADGEHVEAWRAELWRRRERGDLSAVEIVPGARTVLLDGVADPAETARRIAEWPPPAPSGTADGPLVTIPVAYDGSDLPWVAEHWGLSTQGAVDRIASAELRVAFCGFSPGFAYLAGLPAEWAVPRLSNPRPKVPAGSVGLAGEYAGIYPTASPGGWRLVGRTDRVLFDVGRDPPALLVPGTRVRLVPA
ncbi:allophanate hydrolase subunit 1 [Micromonospora sp. CPCC 205371]|nr:allophanate hydrolase subunit 1 [Micromonospora sp. CPCC 205371]